MIQAGGENGPVKIGWSTTIKARLQGLQTSHYDVLRVIRTIKCPEAAEKWLHTKFLAMRLSGEWFRFEPEMLTIQPPFSLPALAALVAPLDACELTVTIRLPLAVKQELKRQARQDDHSASWVVRHLLADWLRKRDEAGDGSE